MKIKSLILAMFACTAFVACSDVDVIDEGGQPNANADTYVSVRIALPEAAGTRAAQEYEDGDATEYKVTTAFIGIFAADGTCIGTGKYNTGELNFAQDGTTTDNITTTSKKVTVKAGKNPSYAMAVLNTTTSPFTIGSKYLNNVATITSIADVAQANNFYMSSSNYAVDGEVTDGHTKIAATNWTANENGSADPITIHVERAVAKVNVTTTLSGSNGVYDVRGAVGSETTGDKVKIVGWGLNITNNSYYPVKKIQATWTSFESDNNIWKNGGWNAAGSFRSFWAIDPNYSGDDTFADAPFTTIAAGGAKTALGSNEYCLENTFINNYQTTNQTTTAIVRAKYMPKGTAVGAGEYLYKIGAEFYNGDDALKARIVTDLAAMNFVKSNNEAITGTDLSFEYTQRGYTKVTVAGGVYTKGSPAVEVEDFNITKNVYATGIAAYFEGYCAYPVLIRHFNDTEVPLAAVNTESQLGRYGVVRNHVYKLSISAISGIGIPGGDDDIVTPPLKPTDPTGPVGPTDPTIDPTDPIDPTQPATPDDNVNVYIQCKIAILAWAARSQDVIL